MFFDAHLHSSHPPNAELRAEGLYLSCSASPADWQILLNDPGVFPFLGIHPECLKQDWEEELDVLDMLLEKHPRAGIGECGLDKRFYKTVSRLEQERALKVHFELARKHKRSIVLHQVQASGALADFLAREKPETPVMIHGFSGSIDVLKRFIRQELFISLGFGVHHNQIVLREMLRLIPEDKLLLESDWPYAEKGWDKSYGELMNIHYEKISAALGIDIEALAGRMRENGTLFTD